MENMNTFRIDPNNQISKTPPPQVFPLSHDDWHNQSTSQRQYYNPFSEQAVSPWQQYHYLNDHSDGNAHFISGSGLTPNTPPDDGSSPSSPGWDSQYNAMGSYGSSNTSYSQGLGSIGPRSTQSGSSRENSHQVLLTGMPLVASPGGLAGTASSPSLFDQSGPATQATVYATHPTNRHFSYSHKCLQYLVGQEQQLASGLRDQEPYHSPNAGSLVSFLPPPLPPPPPPSHQPTYHGEEGGAVADQPNPSPHKCDCGATFGRRTDLERHQETSKKHGGDQRGPVCPVEDCEITSRFTRVDNLRTHCRNQHRMGDNEINTYIREWKEWRMA